MAGEIGGATQFAFEGFAEAAGDGFRQRIVAAAGVGEERRQHGIVDDAGQTDFLARQQVGGGLGIVNALGLARVLEIVFRLGQQIARQHHRLAGVDAEGDAAPGQALAERRVDGDADRPRPALGVLFRRGGGRGQPGVKFLSGLEVAGLGLGFLLAQIHLPEQALEFELLEQVA